MKRTEDDFAAWRLRQEHNSKPFPHIFPDMPPRFRRYYAFTRAAFLMELGSFALAGLCGCIIVIPLLVFDFDAVLKKPIFAFFLAVFLASCSLCVLSMLLISTSKIFWRCPCCGLPFPYYAPRRSSLDILKEKECLLEMKDLHIKYVQPRFCPLVIPSVCPGCRARFFDMGQASSSRTWTEQ